MARMTSPARTSSALAGSECLLEIGVEELPWQFIAPALRALDEAASRALGEQRLAHGVKAPDIGMAGLRRGALAFGVVAAAWFARFAAVAALPALVPWRGMAIATGKTLMDRACPEGVRDDPEQGVLDSEALIGRWHGRFVHVPMTLAVRKSRKVDPDGDLWISVIESTGQPRSFG